MKQEFAQKIEVYLEKYPYHQIYRHFKMLIFNDYINFNDQEIR